MGEEKSVKRFLDVDEIDDWINQFVIDPYFDQNIDGIRMDLFETESSYIIEVFFPGFNEKEIAINVVSSGIKVSLNQKGKKTEKFIKLPFSNFEKRVSVTLEHFVLEININKNKKNRVD